MNEYLLVMTKDERNALGAVRGMTGLLVTEADYLYVRGIDEVMINDKRVKQLPVLHSYKLDDKERMFPLNSFTPVALLPSLKWLPIHSFLKIELPISALPGRLNSPLTVHLVPSQEARESCAMITTISIWKQYVERAPAARINHLEFAVASNGDALILGTPLPSIPGKEFYKESGVLVPAGYAFEAPLVASILHDRLNAEKDSVLLFTAPGEWHRILISSFVKATRSGVRLTTK